MAWELRSGGCYYYRSHRIGSRVVKQYIGTGIAGHLAAEEQVRINDARSAERAERARLASIEAEIAAAAAITESAVRAELMAAGYHRHKRQWRKRRNG